MGSRALVCVLLLVTASALVFGASLQSTVVSFPSDDVRAAWITYPGKLIVTTASGTVNTVTVTPESAAYACDVAATSHDGLMTVDVICASTSNASSKPAPTLSLLVALLVSMLVSASVVKAGSGWSASHYVTFLAFLAVACMVFPTIVYALDFPTVTLTLTVTDSMKSSLLDVSLHAHPNTTFSCGILTNALCHITDDPSAAAMAAATREISILHFNDFYTLEGIDDWGGIARAKTIRDQYPDDLLVFSGDAFSGALLSTLFHGSHMIEPLNSLNITIATAGNHEFDYGMARAEELFPSFNFDWMLANIVKPDTTEPISGLTRTKIVEHMGVKIGFFGVATDWRFLTSISGNADFLDLVETSQTLVNELRADGAELVIAVTHSDIAGDLLMVEEVTGIDLVLGGHDHSLYDSVHKNGVIIWKSEYELANFGRLHLTIVKRDGELPVIGSVRTELIVINSSIAKDPTLDELIESYKAQLDGSYSEKIGYIETYEMNVTRTRVRSVECNFGSMVADVMVEKVTSLIQNPNNYHIVGVANGGGIRCGVTLPVGMNLTIGDVIKCLPFGNTFGAIEITGQKLMAALERSVSKVTDIDPPGQFLQVSGITFEYSRDLAAFSRLISLNYTDGGTVGVNDTIILVSNSFIISGSDGYDMFAGSSFIIDPAAAQREDEVLINWIKENPIIERPVFEGRINVVATDKRFRVERQLKNYQLADEDLDIAQDILNDWRARRDAQALRL